MQKHTGLWVGWDAARVLASHANTSTYYRDPRRLANRHEMKTRRAKVKESRRGNISLLYSNRQTLKRMRAASIEEKDNVRINLSAFLKCCWGAARRGRMMVIIKTITDHDNGGHGLLFVSRAFAGRIKVLRRRN